MRFALRYFFDAGSGICLWAGNASAEEQYGYAIELDALPLSDATRAAADAVMARYDTCIDWSDPGGPSPWTEAEEAAFAAAARELLQRIREELGADYEVRDEI